MKKQLLINGRRVGPKSPAYIIAELSANHHQKFSEAVKMIYAAKRAGADAVKLQTYTADSLTLPCRNKHFMIRGGTLWDGKSLYELYEKAYMPWDWQPKLKKIADRIGITLFSSPFDQAAIHFLEQMDVPAYKVASFELVDIPLIEKIASTGKPIILSTGMATLAEIQDAINAVLRSGNRQIALLKCTSAYPATPDEMNLRTIPDLCRHFRCPIGLSDHSMSLAVPLSAVALGATIIEKHFTLSRKVKGPDSAFSLEPEEFSEMVRQIRFAEQALGAVHYGVTRSERATKAFRRSLFAIEDIKKGEPFSCDNVRAIRPAHGLSPKHLGKIIGRKALVAISKGTPLRYSHFK